MLLSIAQIIVAAAAIIVLIFAYFKNNALAKFSAFVILAAILIAQLFNGLAGLISSVDFLNFLESIFKGIADLIIYAELVVLVLLMFFSKFKSKEIVLNVSLIVYIILVLLIQFGVFN